ncbi:uncoordinated protein 58-like [Contarinia nasturtii]|uniref:uncoordinated protein 58-like n=1 Tax=Contarinia nasturtii TaxID=265458 RepID=UPI0012D412BB|nr:uncoordinated protein 58-like [Contarinia nasturtii]
MAEKDATRYRYEPYQPLASKQQNNSGKSCDPPTTLKIGGSTTKGKKPDENPNANRCCCMGPKARSFWISLLMNLGICSLLFGYTLLGSFLFLAIEGGASTMQQRTLASTNRHRMSSSQSRTTATENVTLSEVAAAEALEARQKTVENIWEITVSLNILYRENWTRLAALEISRFQDQLIRKLTDEMNAHQHHQEGSGPATGAVIVPYYQMQEHEWTLARAFLYSLTVLTTIGYGDLAPRTTLGRIVTMVYAMLGIPLTLIYLSSTGGVLARVARGVFSRALCCCLCSNCGYCCYDEKRMAEKERRLKRKRQQEEIRAQQLSLQEPYYVRSNALHNNLHSPEKQIQIVADVESISTSESKASMHGLSILAPILLCLSMMIIYVLFGALALIRLEEWTFIDAIYFCFMSLSTVGFGDMRPDMHKESTTTTWFCSIYIMCGMALTAMCYNVLHQEIAHRLRTVVDAKHKISHISQQATDDPNDFFAS